MALRFKTQIKQVLTVTLTLCLFLLMVVFCSHPLPLMAQDYDADTVDVIDIENMPWGMPPTEDIKTEGNKAYSPTDFLSESSYQTHKRTLEELNQVLKTIYSRNPSYLPQLAMFKVSPATRLFNAFIYNRGAFFIGAGFWNALQTPDARAFMILNAITWKKNHGADKAQRITLHSKFGVFPAGLPLLLITGGVSLPYNGWASYQAYRAYPNFVFKTDRLTLDQLQQLNYNPAKAAEALNIIADTDAFTFIDQPAKTFYEAQTGRSVYDPSNYRLLRQGLALGIPKPAKRYQKLTNYWEKQTKANSRVHQQTTVV
jgi:hypothetical protein